MAKLDFGGTVENVVTRDEFPVEKAREVPTILLLYFSDLWILQKKGNGNI